MRKKLQVVACILVAALLVSFATPVSTVWAIDDGAPGEISADVNFYVDDIGGGGGGSAMVNYGGSLRSVYRGGDSFIARQCDVKINSQTKLLDTTHGISVNVNLSNIISSFGSAYRIDYIPTGLSIIQKGNNLEHYEIVPSYPMEFDYYQSLLDQIGYSESE